MGVTDAPAGAAFAVETCASSGGKRNSGSGLSDSSPICASFPTVYAMGCMGRNGVMFCCASGQRLKPRLMAAPRSPPARTGDRPHIAGSEFGDMRTMFAGQRSPLAFRPLRCRGDQRADADHLNGGDLGEARLAQPEQILFEAAGFVAAFGAHPVVLLEGRALVLLVVVE